MMMLRHFRKERNNELHHSLVRAVSIGCRGLTPPGLCRPFLPGGVVTLPAGLVIINTSVVPSIRAFQLISHLSVVAALATFRV